MSTDEKKRNVESGGDVSESDVVTGDENTVQRAGVVVNVERQRDTPAQRDRGRLMPEVEIELRNNITQLTKTVYEFNRALSDSLTKLEATVSLNSKLTEQQIAVIHEQIRITRSQSEQQIQAIERQTELMRKQFSDVDGMRIQAAHDAVPVRPIPVWQPFLTPTILTMIFVLLLWYLAFGGR